MPPVTAGTIFNKMRQHDDDNIGVVTLVEQERLYRRLVASWPNVGRRLKPDHQPHEQVPVELPESEHERWLWSRVEPEPEPMWAEAAGLPDAPHIRRAMRTLMDNGVVLPDGTLSRWIKEYLERLAARVGVGGSVEEDD